MCLSAFLRVRRGPAVLLGRYADDPRWEELTGLDEDRWRAHGRGWTLPASHLRYGEDPRSAARRVADEVLRLPGLRLSEPRVATDFYVPARFPELGLHYDVWFLFDATLPASPEIASPPWYAALEFLDPRGLGAGDFARGHEDVLRRWDDPASPDPPQR